MNPSTLYFSKGHSLFLVALMAAVGGLLIWFLLDHPLFAEPPPLPEPPSASATLAENLAHLDKLREARSREGHGFDRLTGGWSSALLLIACTGIALWEIWMKSWRLISRQAALALQNGQLVLHPSFLNAPQSIALGAIRSVTFDRSDRIRPDTLSSALTAYSLTNRLAMKYGGRLRHILLVDYLDERGHPDRVRISDADVDGGAEQMKRFADYLAMMRRDR